MPLTRAELEGNAEDRYHNDQVDDNNQPLPTEEQFDNSRLKRAINMNKSDPNEHASPAPTSIEARTQKGAKRFPWVLKNWKRKQIMFDGDQAFINETIDPYYAARWYEQNKINKREVKEQFFGDFEVFTLFLLNPSLKLDDSVLPHNVTKDFAEFLGLLTSQRILKEKNFRVWQTILQNYDLYEVENPDPIPNLHFFKYKEAVRRTGSSDSEYLQLSTHPVDTGKITTPEILEQGDMRLINFLKEKAPSLYKLYEKASAIPSDSSKHNQELKLATFEKIMKKFNEQFSDPASRKDSAAPLYSLESDRPEQDDWEHQPLREAANFPAIAGMSITEIQELCAMKEFLEGRIKFKPSILKGKTIEQPYSNVTLTTQYNTEPTSPTFKQPITIHGHYTSSVRYAMFGQEKYYKRIRPGQTLQPRQWIAKLYKGWVTTVVAPRRGGKCSRELECLRTSKGTFIQAKDVKVGDELLSSDKTTPTKVLATDHFQKECVKITLTDGTSFTVSKDHRIPTQDTYHNGEWDMDIDNYTTAENLKPGKDFVPTMYGIGENDQTGLGIQGSYTKGLLIGLLLGDGSLTQSHTSICCTEECRRKIIYDACDRLGFNYHPSPDNRSINISGISEFRKEFNLYGGSYEKKIPGQIFGYSSHIKWGVVNGLLYTDGYLSVEGEKKGKDGYIRSPKCYIEYSTVSKELAEGLRIILCDLGIISSISQKKKKTRFNHKEYIIEPYYIRISDKESLRKIINHCIFEGKKNIDEFTKILYTNDTHTSGKLGLIPKCAFKEHTVQGVGHRTLYNGVRSPDYDFQRWKCENYGCQQRLKYNWVKVEKVEDVGMQNVVHIECDGDHTYWLSSVLTHNSYRAIDEAVEMFTADTQDRSRPIRVLFVGINTKKLKTVIKYLLSFTKEFAQAGYFDREASKNIMHYRRKATANKKATEADDLGTIEFIGSKDEDAGVGDYADLIIIDECERIDENVREDILPIITNEGARCILISTLNKNSQKTWFYQQLIQGETEELQRNLTQQDVVTVIREKRNKRVQPVIDKAKSIEASTNQPVPFEERINWIDIDAMSADMRIARQRVGLRFTGEDTDLKTDQEKAFARDRLRGTKAYYPEWRAIFPEDTGVYDYEGSVKDSSYFDGRQYKFIVVAYDPAESKDKAALCYMGYDAVANKIELFKTEKLPNNYTYHGPFIERTLIECQQRIDQSSLPDNIGPDQRVFFAYDFNGVGQGLEPFFVECGVRIDLKVRFTGQGGITKKGINHNVPKELLVNMLQNTMDHGALVINQDCLEFIEELDHYKSYYNPDTGNTKYQAEHGATDDFVSAAMIGAYFILEYMGEKFNITKNEIEQAIDPDNDFSVNDMFEEVERIVMEGVNNGKTVQQVIDEYNGRSQRNSLRRQDVLSQFGY